MTLDRVVDPTRGDQARVDRTHGTATRLLAGLREGRPLTYQEHRLLTGALPLPDLAWLISATEAVSLRGRGGAAFPVAAKLAATPPGPATEIVVNGSESEPASAKDRTLMWHAPHQAIDGALAVAHALGTRQITIAVHDPTSATILRAACAERTDAHAVRVTRIEGRFVSGEVRAMLNGLEGRAAVPAGRRVLPHVAGLSGQPTFASNVETFAQIGALVRLGVDAYAVPDSPAHVHEAGTSLLTLLGDVPTPGVVEAAHGVPLATLTGPLDGRPVLVGGYHGSWTTADDLTLDRDALRARRSPLGAGVIAVLPPGTCSLGEVTRVATWLADQSARQCGPCLFGLHSVAEDLVGIHAGSGQRLHGLRSRLGLLPGRGACSHPDGASRFVATALDAFAGEVDAHARGGGCGRPTLGVLPLDPLDLTGTPA
ncbi:MAG: NADH-ubiquinone oxidoreductase-F iron-sulfur binding region domain-containing protein [Nocardioides sp.]|uniref:NADH-ubiquinone oxidoreductase-F iron-sulfur binding region domain-containing protein n=1 Tax=Nocardioides sp. TaxID=35761 RepID=UPI0039E25729